MNIFLALLSIPIIKIITSVLMNILRLLVALYAIGLTCLLLYVLTMLFQHLKITHLLSTYVSTLSNLIK